MAYSQGQMAEREVRDPNELQALVNQWPVVWVDVIGLGSACGIHILERGA